MGTARDWGIEGGSTRNSRGGGSKPPRESSGSTSKSVVTMISVGLGVPFLTFVAAVGWVIKEHA